VQKYKQSLIEQSAEFFPKVICGYARWRQLSSESEEGDLVKYLRDASQMFFGLSPNETRKLAFEFATSVHKPVAESWTSGQMAGRSMLNYTASFVIQLHGVIATPAESGKNWCCV